MSRPPTGRTSDASTVTPAAVRPFRVVNSTGSLLLSPTLRDNDGMTREDVTDLVERIRPCLDARSEILEAYVFGSAARGELQPHSDVDVAVYVDEPDSRPSRYGYAAELTEALMRTLETDRVDVVVLNRAPPVLYHRVLRDGIRVLARDLAATTVREGRALSRYCDYVPQLRKIEAQHAARIARGSFGR